MEQVQAALSPPPPPPMFPDQMIIVKFDGDDSTTKVLKSCLFLFKDEKDSFLRHWAIFDPKHISRILQPSEPIHPFIASLCHYAVKHLEWWCTEADIAHDENGLKYLCWDITEPMQVLTLGAFETDKHTMEKDYFQNNEVTFTNKSLCQGCLSLREEPQYATGRQLQDVPASVPIVGRDCVDNLQRANHVGAMAMQLAISLLVRQDTDKVVLNLVDYLPTSIPIYKNACLLSDVLSSFVSHFSRQFPMLTELAVGVLALIIIRNPIALLKVQTLALHHCVSTRVNNIVVYMHWLRMKQQSLTEMRFDMNHMVVETHLTAKYVIDLLPLLFHIGGFRDSQEEERTDLAVNVLTLTMYLIDLVMLAPNVCDCANTTRNFPEVARLTPPFMGTLLLCDADDEEDKTWRQDLLKERPVSFAIAGLVEVIGWWGYKGRGFYRDDENLFFSLAETLSEKLALIVLRTHRLAHILSIARTFARREMPGKPNRKKSLLYGPLCFQHRRCGLLSCRKTAEEAGGTLLRCAGGCDGLEQYCCREHQLEHWKDHKTFCKGIRRKMTQGKA